MKIVINLPLQEKNQKSDKISKAQNKESDIPVEKEVKPRDQTKSPAGDTYKLFAKDL